jgi:hypothetical protein
LHLLQLGPTVAVGGKYFVTMVEANLKKMATHGTEQS